MLYIPHANNEQLNNDIYIFYLQTKGVVTKLNGDPLLYLLEH